MTSIDWHPDGTAVVTGSWDNTAIVWDLSSHRRPNVVLKGHNWNIRGCAFSPDGTRIITGSEDRTARVWDSATGEEIYKLGSVNNVERAKGHVHQVWATYIHA